MSLPDLHYCDYLRLDKILDAQQLQSDQKGHHAHDEMLFIIIHQAYELWFKQLLYEVESVTGIMKKPSLNDNSPELQTVVHRLSRCSGILKVLVHQVDILETMNPMDFLDFRDMLRPASGFQSWQFKLLEARLGLKYEQRYSQGYYISQLRPAQVDLIKKAEAEKSLLDLVNSWLERMPFLSEANIWRNFASENISPKNPEEAGFFWQEYRELYRQSLAEEEKANFAAFEGIFGLSAGNDPRSLSASACRSALFIMLYQGFPVLQLPFQLLQQLLDIDEQMSTWRYRHMHMVHRMIGSRIGTGGSTGKDYLKGALDKHIIFREIAQLSSFLIERKKLPRLNPEMEKRLGFVQQQDFN
jgi:tryptophan 2,3-dioxygenase